MSLTICLFLILVHCLRVFTVSSFSIIITTNQHAQCFHPTAILNQSYDYNQLEPITDSSPTSHGTSIVFASSHAADKIIDQAMGATTDETRAIPFSKNGTGSFQFPSNDDLALLPNGKKGGYKVLHQYTASKDLLWTNSCSAEKKDEMTIQEALNRLDSTNYQSLSKARKACRKGSILIHRGPITSSMNGNTSNTLDAFSQSCNNSFRARVGDKIYANDQIGIQQFMGTFRKKRCYPLITYSRPKFVLPVLYEDDYMAIVDKPAGIGMYGNRKKHGKSSSSSSRRTIRDALPYCLSPPKKGTTGTPLHRPMAVHRLDTPTNGLVVVAKTKEALQHLSEQFETRRVQKTYTAIVNGIPIQNHGDDKHNDWNIVNYPLGNRHAITQWKTIRSVPSLHAKDGTLSLIRVKPLTGRYHQIRRHMAWICRRPLVGDHIYAGQLQAPRFYRNGLYLCSNGLILEHPYYNSVDGRKDWSSPLIEGADNTGHTCDVFMDEHDHVVKVRLEKQIPKRFEKLLNGEEAWANARIKAI